jgi:hypothetical protein
LRRVGTDGKSTSDGFRSADEFRILADLRKGVTYSWYDPKPFWYLYFSGVVNLVTGMVGLMRLGLEKPVNSARLTLLVR